MKLPRDLTGADLAKALHRLDYVVTRQSGSHLRITTLRGGEHHEVIPNHSPIKIGTLQSLLRNIAAHHGMAVPDLIRQLEL
ncbi:MAG: type II toxin-antitoxin system HicA family toxin [Xanthomonadales bacterium]|nr:type II toxin-antitoxin system HicA family toxin [Xanthomonadales bacterium]MBK7146845.1 type II toxin-antitoxin system HicA family toxin [Xanthomonadales bacterium]MCC6560689.1 type II toxin-antitoxin system HicA family toxin [Xanthomonadales bacterium]